VFDYDPSADPPSRADTLEVAGALGARLSELRLNRLVVMGLGNRIDTWKFENIPDRYTSGKGWEGRYFQSGGFKVALSLANIPSTSNVDVHFVPTDKNGNVVDMPDRTQCTEFLLSGLRGLQDYILTVESGYIRRPEFLYGDTNESVALLAKRVGFRQITDAFFAGEVALVQATTDEIKNGVFSEEMHDCERLLESRLARAGVLSEDIDFYS